MAVEGSSDSSPSGSLGSPDDDRGESTIDESIDRAESGSQADRVHAASDPGATGKSRREEIRSEGSDVTVEHPAVAVAPDEPGLSPTETGSGGAQNIAGGRISDRVAGGQPTPDEPPFDSAGESRS